MIPSKTSTFLLLAALSAASLAGCVGNDGTPDATTPTRSVTGGILQQAGSSTVFPIAAAWAEELAAASGGKLQVTVAGGGSGAGASKLCAKEIDIADMSRELKGSEIEKCRANGIDPLAWKVAYDGITVVMNSENTFVDHLTVAELDHIWRSQDPAQTWADVRAGWPASAIVLYGPDTDSGTYEYFNEVILGKKCGADSKSQCAPRSDYTPSADDNVLVEGVARSKFAIGHFGFAYYTENAGRLKAVPIVPEGGNSAVAPTHDTIADGTYAPLGRPIFMITNGAPAPASAMHSYFEYAMNEGQALIRDVGYVELDPRVLDEQRAWL